MRNLLATAFVLTTILATIAGGAQAMPLAPAAATPNADVIQVAGGCGAGFHRGPYGGCLANFANPGAHACPRGFHVGPGGGCIGNGR
jgi:hypothetical protein